MVADWERQIGEAEGNFRAVNLSFNGGYMSVGMPLSESIQHTAQRLNSNGINGLNTNVLILVHQL